MGMAEVIANVEGIDIFWSDDGCYLVEPNELAQLPIDKIVAVLKWCEDNSQLGKALDVFVHLQYKYNEQFMKVSDLILISNGPHNDEKARRAAKKILAEM